MTKATIQGNVTTTIVKTSVTAAPGSAGALLVYTAQSSKATIVNTSATAGFEYKINSGAWKYVGRNGGAIENINFVLDRLYFRQVSDDLSTTTVEISVDSPPALDTDLVNVSAVMATTQSPLVSGKTTELRNQAGVLIQANDVFPGLQSLQRRPGVSAFSVTSSTGADGWQVTNGTIADSTITWPDGTLIPAIRIQGNSPGSAQVVTLRRKLTSNSNPGVGKVEFPIFCPITTASGMQITVGVTNDAGIANPPTGAFTNKLAYTHTNSIIKRGFAQVLSVDMSCTANDAPNITGVNAGVAPTSTGTPNALSITGLELVVNFNAGTTTYIDLGVVSLGAKSTPYLMICADSAGSSLDHQQYFVPRAEKKGFKLGLACRQDFMAANFTILDRHYKSGHDILNEGVGHKNYSTFATSLLADAETARSTMVGYGWTRGALIFAAPNFALNSGLAGTPGINDLFSAGYKFMRCNNRSNIPFSAFGKEVPSFSAYQSGGDYATLAGLITYLDSLELHGESGMLLYHNIITGTPASGSTDTNLTVYQSQLDEIGNRVAQGRLLVISPSEFVNLYNS